MPPQAGQPQAKSPQIIIDLTLSDDEEVTPRTQSHSGLLIEVPPMQHGLPMFTIGADQKTKRRDGASGMNYAERAMSRSIAPTPNSIKPHPRPRIALPSNKRQSALRPSASLENLSSRSVLMNGPQNLANTAKRRKTTHDGVPLGGRRKDATSGSVGAQASPSSTLQKTSQPVDLTLSPPAAKSRTVITGANRLQSSYDPEPSPDDGLVQKSLALESQDDDSKAILQMVFELIKRALQPYHIELSLADQKEITAKVQEKLGLERSHSLTPAQTAAWLIRPELRTNYQSNNGRFARRYEKEMAQEAKAYVDSYVQTLRELNSRPMRLDAEESEGGSSSSATEDIFERQHPRRVTRSYSYSDSPTTELSNDQPDGTGDSEPGGKGRGNAVAGDLGNTLRRSERAKRSSSQSQYVFGNKRRRKNKQPGNVDLAGESLPSPMDLDYKAENMVINRSPDFDLRDELAGIKAVARTMQAPPKKPEVVPSERDLLSLLRQRETHGRSPLRVAGGRPSFKAVVYAKLEDSFTRQSEWTDSSGDIQSISWISEDAFLCGATAHLDSHNMEYNKPGNLLLGSTTHDTIRSFADHRVPRPKSDKPNAESMQQTQDPWLYSSVVSTAHCKKSGFCFTASFDETVKIWSIHQDGSSMELAGTWKHGGKVNFVVTSDHHERVATASGVTSNAVRVYNFDETSISGSAYEIYGGNKALSQTEDGQETKPWSYQPATIQWGKAPQVANLLLVGYSPRSDTGDDADIPDDKKNTGELCVWNTGNGEPVIIASSHLQNVFEVQWHPTQPIFVAATSPSGLYDSDKTKTQIRLFALNDQELFTNTRALDCSALDINELTITPNSEFQCYVTASCTDGNTYVYDTAQGDQAIHVLQHGDPLDDLDPELPREIGDTGVQFAAWGQTTNRFYTGSSDGKVKAWNIKNPAGKAFVRDLLDLAGAIISGAFSKDFSKLLIGDATGKVHLMSVDDNDLEGGPVATINRNSSKDDTSGQSTPSTKTVRQGGIAEIKLQQLLTQKNGILSKNIKRPKLILPHREPPPPEGYELNQQTKETPAADIARHYLNEGMLEQRVGLGVFQGPNYAETGWYDRTAHEDGDPEGPLLPQFHEEQQFVMRKKNANVFDLLSPVVSSDAKKHEENMSLDLDLSKMSLDTQQTFRKERIEIEGDFAHTYNYEICPETTLWGSRKKTKSEALTGKAQERSMGDEDEMMK